MFESAKLKIERANQHIAELDATLLRFFQTKPYRVLSDFDEKFGVYGLRVEMGGSIPPQVGVIIGDVVHNLRSALEHVASDVMAAALGNEARSRSYFPMHEERENLVDTINKGEIHAHFPEVADAILNLVKPFKRGNNLLWLVGKLWNIDKHRLPITSYGITSVEGIYARDERDNTIGRACGRVDQGQTVRLWGTDTPITVTQEGQASFYVQFDEPGLLEGDPVVPTLAQMSKLTSEAVWIIEQALNGALAAKSA
jgi:hypothetical protein